MVTGRAKSTLAHLHTYEKLCCRRVDRDALIINTISSHRLGSDPSKVDTEYRQQSSIKTAHFRSTLSGIEQVCLACDCKTERGSEPDD